MMRPDQVIDTDVLVLGGGASGLRAASEAASAGGGLGVLLCCQYPPGKSGSTFYPGAESVGISFVNRPNIDSEAQFLAEILEAGQGAADPVTAGLLAAESGEAVAALEQNGLSLRRGPDGEYRSVVPCFGRTLRGGNAEMSSYFQCLWGMAMRGGVRVQTGLELVSLVMHRERCCGAVAFDGGGRWVWLRARATILATGGASAVFAHSMATPEQCGSGYIMAFDSGATLVNMEFQQFALGMTWPVPRMDICNKALTGIVRIANRQGAAFMEDRLPAGADLATCLAARVRDDPFSTTNSGHHFDIALFDEWRAGNALDSGGLRVWFDRERLMAAGGYARDWADLMARRGIDIYGTGIDVLPHAFAFNGGVQIDRQAGAGVPGLYAAGEVAGGPHGADRLGGNAMAATQVFGTIAGRNAALYARSNAPSAVSETQVMAAVQERFDCGKGEIDVEAEVVRQREAIWRFGALSRSEKAAESGLDILRDMATRMNLWTHLRPGHEARQAFRLYTSIRVSILILEVIRRRKESRGPHHRSDYPRKDDRYTGYFTVQKQDGKPQFNFCHTGSK